MRVFKTCFKVIYKHRASMLIYFFIFLFFAVLLSYTNNSGGGGGFTVTRANVAFFNGDGDTPLVRGLRESLARNADFVTIPDTPEGTQDALFYGRVNYIVRIPKGFTASFLGGGALKIERTAAPGSASGTYMDFTVRRYLGLAQIAASVPGASQAQVVSQAQSALKAGASVTMRGAGTAGTKAQTYYYRYLAYVLMAVIILSVTSVMLAFNRPDLRRRNLCAPVGVLSMNLQQVLGNLVFAFIAAAAMTGLSFALYGRAMLEPATAWLLLNASVYTLVCLAVSFLIGSLIRSRNAQSACANVVALGTCFISGVFVPQEYLGKTVLTIASFTPTYWYVRVVNLLNDSPAPANSGPVASGMLIELGFAVALLAVSLVVAKYKRTGENMAFEELE